MATSPPRSARFVGPDLLEITWADGRVLHYAAHELRAQCPCAACVNPPPGVAPRTPESFAGIALKSLKQVGTYAFQIGFDDGHALGIYSFDKLREMGHPPGQAPPAPPRPTTEFSV